MNKFLLFICCVVLAGCVDNQNAFNQQLCSSIETNDVTSLQQRTSKSQPIDCKIYKDKFSSSNDDVLNKKLTSVPEPIAKYPQSVIKNYALEACKETIMAGLYVPSSFEQNVSNTTIRIVDKNGVTIKMPFTAKNGLGKPTAQVAYCVTNSWGKILMLNITNR